MGLANNRSRSGHLDDSVSILGKNASLEDARKASGLEERVWVDAIGSRRAAIDVFVFMDLEVEMVPERVAGVADRTDFPTLGDLLSFDDVQAVQVGVDGRIGLTVDRV